MRVEQPTAAAAEVSGGDAARTSDSSAGRGLRAPLSWPGLPASGHHGTWGQQPQEATVLCVCPGCSSDHPARTPHGSIPERREASCRAAPGGGAWPALWAPWVLDPLPPAGPRRGRPGCPARVPAAAQCQLTGRELRCHLGRLYPRETVSLWVRQSTPSPELPHRPLERLCHPPGARCPPASGPGGPGGPGLSRHVQRETPASWPCWSGLVWF